MDNQKLIEYAIKAQSLAQPRYSGFRVGACLLAKNGSLYMGCNIENSSYGATICAERVAIFKAISEGVTEFSKIAIVGGEGNEFTYPCGICLQVMNDWMPQGTVVLSDGNRIEEIALSELLPHGFVF